jgi:hypothetical protein
MMQIRRKHLAKPEIFSAACGREPSSPPFRIARRLRALPIYPQRLEEFLRAFRFARQIFSALGTALEETLALRIRLTKLGPDACDFFG